MVTWITILLVVIVILAAGMLLFNLYLGSSKKKQLLFEIDGSIKINPLRDLIYKKVARRDLGMDVYLPGNPGAAKFPAVILVHGDGPEGFIKDAKDWTLFSSYGRLLAGMGFAGIAFNHRGAGSNWMKVNDAATDIMDAVDFVKRNAVAWNVDEERICVWAFSAGGIYLSLFLKDNPKVAVKCLISYYGLLDLQTWVKDFQKTFTDYTPEQYLAGPDVRPPFLIVKAAKDIPRINDSVANFIRTADVREIKYELLIHSSGRHAFDVLDDSEETRSIIKRTLEFIKQNI